MMVLIERVSFIVPFLASHNIKRSFADLHLLCFYIIGHCFCPGNLGEKKAVRQLKIEKKGVWATEPDIVVSFTHNTVGDLPGIMQETEISPLQRLTCHFVSQFVPAVKEVERDRGMKSERLYRPILILRLYRLTVGSLTRHRPAVDEWSLVLRRSFELHNIV